MLHQSVSRSTILLLCLFTTLRAQDQPFRIETRVVEVPVTVTAKDGRSVDGLTARDFAVHDNGVLQQITVDPFGADTAHISLAIAVQTSGVSRLALAKINKIGGMIQPLVTGLRGEAAVVTFDKTVTWREDFTSQDDRIRRAIRTLKPESAGRARMFDAVIEAANRMKDRKGRKILLLVSEGRDQSSEATFQQAVEAVELRGIEVFAAPYSAYAMSWISKPEDLPEQAEFNAMFFTQLGRLFGPNHAKALAHATGGSEYPFTRERGIENAIENLGADVHRQYMITFQQRDASRGRHWIEVAIPARADVQIRSRLTYFVQ
jgi:VWFA-related protein